MEILKGAHYYFIPQYIECVFTVFGVCMYVCGVGQWGVVADGHSLTLRGEIGIKYAGQNNQSTNRFKNSVISGLSGLLRASVCSGPSSAERRSLTPFR